MAATGTSVQQSYTFKASPWSSHSQVLERIPAAGHGKTLLDVGCWDGALASILAARGYAVTGLEGQSWPPGRFPTTVRLIVSDLHHGIPEIAERFDIIVCADVLEHLLENRKVLEQLRRLLKPGGRLIASLPNSGNIYFRAVILSGRFPQDEKGLFDRTHIHFYTWSGWQELFASSGYTMELVTPTPIPFTVMAGADSGIATFAERLYVQVAGWWKTLLAYQFVVTARALDE
jgi:SAM-dependent methyltransferase